MLTMRSTLIVLGATTTVACASSDIAIRSVPGSSLSANSTPSARVAEGYTKLAMGSVGLAIEAFRNALREDPTSIDALEGMALSYQQLGRYDLASRQFEAALAIAPRNMTLLQRLAASRDAEGKAEIASEIRAEIASIQAAESKSQTPVVALVAKSVGQDSRLSMPAHDEPASLHDVGPGGPRLVRLNLGEIALVTRPGPLWERSNQQAKQASRPAEILLLNAARVGRLAARTKALMNGAGWRNITVADAPAIRSDSVIKYPVHARTAAARLSVQYGIRAEVDPKVRFITVYLGADSAHRVRQS